MKELGIYIHIPFCKQKCIYCDFISYQNKQSLGERYIENLKSEIKSSKLDLYKYKVTTIYIGGGTPSFIDAKYIEEILILVKEKFLVKDAEITIEVNPGTLDKEKLEKYYEIGINRLSIGLQSTNDNLLKLIGRIHNYSEFLDTYNLARQVGFKNINIDLMIGLPTQTISDVEQTVKQIIKLKSEHISVYSLILEEGTLLKDKIEKGELILPSDEVERKMYWTVKRELEAVGFDHYEISNFSKSGYQSKHNLNCWEQIEYLGFGLAAHSYFKDKRYSNTESLEEYINIGINQNSETIEIHEIQNKQSQMKEYMLLGLRKIKGVKISEFKNKFVKNPLYEYMNELHKLENEELIEIDSDNIKLTNKGIDFANLVWEEFI